MSNQLVKNTIAKGFFILAFSLKSILATAQYASVFFNNVSINQGLSQSCVVDIAFDSKGFAWLATQDGLNRYDGKDFFVADKKFDDITSGFYSRLGKIVPGNDQFFWIISKGGVLEKFNLATNNFKVIELSEGKIKQEVTCVLAYGNERLWIATASGKLILYNVKTDKIINTINVPAPPDKLAINALFIDKHKRLWVIGAGLWYLEGGHLNNEVVNVDALKGDTQYSSLITDKGGNMWLGSLAKGLFLKQKDEQDFKQFKGYKEASFPSDLVIEALLADNEGNIWVGTYGKGLFVINSKDKKISHLVNDKRNQFSLPFNDVLCIKQDANGGVWIGTDGGGVSYINQARNNFITFNNQTVPQNTEIALVRSITTDKDDNIWAGTTNNGLTQINYKKAIYKTWHFPSYKKSIYNPNRVVSLYNDDDNLTWVGTQGNGLILFSSKEGKIIKWFHPESSPQLNIPDATIWCMYPNTKRQTWLGTESSGLCLLDKQSGLIGSYKPNGNAPADAVRSIVAINDSTLCIGFEKTGIRFFNTVKKTFTGDHSRSLNALFNIETNIKCLYYNSPLLWIGTGGRGILTYNITTEKTNLLTTKQGLPNNTIYAILPDKKGYLWISTNKGLSRFMEAGIENQPGLSQITNYTAAQGLQSNEFNTGAFYKSPDGMLLFGGINGLNLFDPSKFNNESKATPVVFTKILVDNEPIAGDTAAPFKKTVILNYQNHSVSFNFAALDFFSSPQYYYYYKLEGYDKGWINANQRNYVSYTNVPAGRYNFLVKYVKQGSSIGKITRMVVDITGPFWKKAWFIFIVVLLFMAFVYGLYRYRLFQLLKLVQIRQRIATDLHDDIGSTLSNINILSELSKKSLDEPAQAHVFLDRISEEVQSSSQSLDDIIWSINTRNDNWDETFSRIRRYAAEFFENSNINYTIKLDEQAGMTTLKMEKRRDVFLIYKEILNNIHKHAAATEVEITMLFEGNQLMMAISDNGKGFDKNAKTHRNGLNNLRTRVARWKGSISIESSDSGTHIRILI